MNDRFFLDTNIFVYSFDRRANAKTGVARKLVENALATGRGMISYQVVQEFLNLAVKRAVIPITVSDAEQYLSDVLHPLLSVHSSKELFVEALHLHSRYKLSWYDTLIVAAAIRSECQVLFTEDLQHGQKFGRLCVENPFL